MFSFLIQILTIDLTLFHACYSYERSLECSKNCRCSMCPLASLQNETEMSCNASSLENIQVPRNTCSIILSGNGITTLNIKSIRKFNGTVSLDLSHNKITNLPKRVFSGVQSLKTLYLNDNSITKIQQASFSGLTRLQHRLDLSFNLITKILKKVFAAMQSLKTLDLNNNFITEIQQAGFSGLVQLKYLDLSHNGLENLTNGVFLGIPTLRTLKLQHNNIALIETKAFARLRDLRRLDLSYNRIMSLSYKAFNSRGNLQHINLNGNNVTEWLDHPTKNTAKVLSLDKPNNIRRHLSAHETKRCSDIRRKSVIIQVERNISRCSKQRNCVIANRTKIITERVNICWEITNKLRPVLFTLGTIAILSNLIVLGTVWSVKSLRTCTPFLLVSHMSFCDTLVGVYSFGMAFGHGKDSFDEFKAWKGFYCPAFRSIFLSAVVAGSLTSLLMTSERYLAIVFCMRPNVRLGQKAIAAALVLIWIAGASSATLVQLLDTRYGQINGQMCLIVRNSNKIANVYVSECILLFLVLVYLIIVGLYLHIFVVARRSSRKVNVLRESKLAKRISAIVLSSFVFFAVPNFTQAWFILRRGGVFKDARLNRTFLWWLPPVCLVVNACIDPSLFAFRNDKFVKAVNKITMRSLQRLLLLKKPAVRRDPFMVSNSRDFLDTPTTDSTKSIELKMFSAAENSEVLRSI